MPSETLDGLHHVGTVVVDREMHAQMYRDAFGWRIVAREDLTGAEAERSGKSFGLPGTVTRIQLVMVGPVDGKRAYSEFVELEIDGVDVSDKYQGLQVQAVRVRDALIAFDDLLATGATPLRQPETVVIDGWKTVVATARMPGGVIIELMQLVR